MTPARILMLSCALLAACAKDDLKDPPVDLGDFVLGHNIVVADNVQKVPISRDATPNEWEAAMKKAMADRFGRYEGDKVYNIGVVVEAYALAPPGIPVIAAPKSVLVITPNVWDDAAQKKLNDKPEQLTIFESLDGDNIIGTGLTLTREQQMAALSFNAARAVETWFLAHPEWFDLPPKKSAAAKPEVTTGAEPAAEPTPAAK